MVRMDLGLNLPGVYLHTMASACVAVLALTPGSVDSLHKSRLGTKVEYNDNIMHSAYNCISGATLPLL